MQSLYAVVWLLSETAPAADDGGGGGFGIWPVLFIILALFYIMVVLPQRKKEKGFRTLVQNLKKNDRVVTIGGIHGVVTNVQREADRVSVRIDEATGATIRVNTGAISPVITDDDKADAERGKT
jgi:preprotein translocase subunit YajC